MTDELRETLTNMIEVRETALGPELWIAGVMVKHWIGTNQAQACDFADHLRFAIFSAVGQQYGVLSSR